MSIRSMDSLFRLGYVLVLAGASVLAATSAQSQPDPAVPTEHWAYDVVTDLAKYGVPTGRPDGYFKGKRAVPRLDFAETIGFILGDTKRLEGEGAFWPSHRREPDLKRLVTEFRPELAAMGATEADVRSGLERFERVWRDPKPRGVTEPLPGSRSRWLIRTWPDDLPARHVGYREALAEWERGQVVLYYIPEENPRELKADLSKAIRFKPLENSVNSSAIQKALGHNAAMWKWLREKGPPSERLGWLRQIFDLQRLAAGQKPSEVTPGGALSPEGAIILEHKLAPEGSYLTANGRYLPLDFLSSPFGSYRTNDFRWGEAGTGIARFDVGFKSGRRTYAVDCRTGCILNAR